MVSIRTSVNFTNGLFLGKADIKQGQICEVKLRSGVIICHYNGCVHLIHTFSVAKVL